MLNDLKKEITDCYMYGEIICQQGFGPKTDISMHDMIRFDLLQFLVYQTAPTAACTRRHAFYTNISDNISHWNL